jgi:hypothetical protein
MVVDGPGTRSEQQAWGIAASSAYRARPGSKQNVVTEQAALQEMLLNPCNYACILSSAGFDQMDGDLALDYHVTWRRCTLHISRLVHPFAL